MTQSTYPYAEGNESGAAYRAGINSGLTAIVSQNPGTVAPSPTFAQMWWADTGNSLLKMRNQTNSAWITVTGLGLGGRIKLGGNITLYVATTGNDATGDGTSGSPWATIQNAWNYCFSSLDLNGFGVTVQLANGTYNITGIVLSADGSLVGATSPGSFTILGNTTTPANVLLQTSVSGFYVLYGAMITINGVKLVSTGSGGFGFNASYGGQLVLGNKFEIGAFASGIHIYSSQRGTIILDSAYTLSGSASYHLNCNFGGLIVNQSCAVTVSGTLAFGTFAFSYDTGLLVTYGSSYSGGTVTGTRYTVSTNAVIDTAGGGASHFPGNVAGGAGSGGQYI